jgi:hypothetical protein
MNRVGFLAGILLTLLGGLCLHAYEILGYKWATETVKYKINQNGTPDCDGEFEAVQRAFDSWSEISTCRLNFEYDGTTIYSPIVGDGENTLVWFTSWPFPPEWNAVAVTLMDTTGWIIEECDLCFNNEDCTWSTTGNPNRDDVENVTAHEVGHWVGLEDFRHCQDLNLDYAQAYKANLKPERRVK